MKTVGILFVLLLLASSAPAYTLADPTPAPTDVLATPTPSPTPGTLPLCSEAGPLVKCLAVQDPAVVLNQRVDQLQAAQQALVQQLNPVFAEYNRRLAELEAKVSPKPTPTKGAKP